MSLLLLLGTLACAKRRAPAPRPYVAFVVNNQSATVAAVDMAKFQVVKFIPVAAQPERAVARPQSRELWVVSASGKISIVAYPELEVTKTLAIGTSARDLAFSADGRHAFVLYPSKGEIVFLDGETGKELARVAAGVPPESSLTPEGRMPLAAALSGLALTPDGKTLIASVAASNRLYFVSTESRKVLGSVEVGKEPGAMVVLPDNSKVFVADAGEEKISAVEVATRQLLSHIELGLRPGVLALKPDGGEIFVLGALGTSMVIVDAAHDNVEQSFPTGHDPVTGIFRRDSSVLYIASAGDGSVMALAVQTRELLASVHVGLEPRALALTPDERFLAVADAAANSLAILQTNPPGLLTAIPVGVRPVDVVVPDWLGGK
ncbi:MAG: hypothetical protein LAP13_02180 [Acidobacteriia bacterium]|nr:hypothetical protein [Terriglobia bacterium]